MPALLQDEVCQTVVVARDAACTQEELVAEHVQVVIVRIKNSLAAIKRRAPRKCVKHLPHAKQERNLFAVARPEENIEQHVTRVLGIQNALRDSYTAYLLVEEI